MPRKMLVFAGLVALLAGCAAPPAPPAAARASLRAPQDDNGDHQGWAWNQATGQARNAPPNNNPPPGNYAAQSAPPANYPPRYSTAQSYPQYSSAPNYPQQNYYPPQNNGYQQQPTYIPSTQGNAQPAADGLGWTAPMQPYAGSGTMTTRYEDPNATAAGPVASPYEVPSAAGPPPGQAAPGYSQPMTIRPMAASIKKAEEDEEWDISHLAPEYTWKKVKSAIGWGPDQKLAKEAYDRGLAFYNEKKYDEAAEQFYIVTWRWPESSLEEDAMFLMGESYFFAEHYGKSQDTFTNLLKEHDNTRYLDTVMSRLFAIGTYWEQLDLKTHHWPVTPNMTDNTQPWFDTFGNAIACYEAVWLHDPTGPLADAALFRVGNAHFRRGEWEEAADKYDMLRKNHPKSKHQRDAHILELQAKMQIYQGPRYSVVPLAEAEEIADQTLRQFPGQLGPEEARVRQVRAQLVQQRAEREWVMAQYYDNKSEFRAAREYYKLILEKYAQSAYAEPARKRMGEIQNEPDEPPKHLTWLTGLFGKGK